MGNQNQMLRDFYFSTKKLSHEMSQKCDSASENDWQQITSSLWNIAVIATS